MNTVKLKDLGYTNTLNEYKTQGQFSSFDIGRVILEHKDRYIVKNEKAEYEAELIGNLRFTAHSRRDLPAVGDWVAISEYDENKALIHGVYPRHSLIERQAVSKSGEAQIIAANIDYGLIVQAVNRDFSINRLERYLTICYASKVQPIVILSKIDLLDDHELETILAEVNERIKDVQIIPISNTSKIGLAKIGEQIESGKTYCLLGSSGVGKSSLLNHLIGGSVMKTGEISKAIDRGKHITTHRELVVLTNGGVLIDNPGMREVGITDAVGGIEMTFDEITELANDCKFNDCSHVVEKGCAILEALDAGDIDQESYDNFRKMEKERSFFESSSAEKRKKDKDFGKMVKRVIKEHKKNKR